MIWKWNFFLLAICTICADPLGTEGRGKEDGKGKEEMLFCYFHRHFIFHNTSLFFWKMFPLFSLHLYEPLHQSTSTLRFSSSNQEKETIINAEILCFLSILGFESFQSSFENSRIWNPRLVFCICSPRTSCQTAISSDQGQFYTLQSRKRFHHSPAPLTWFSILRPFSRSKYHS